MKYKSELLFELIENNGHITSKIPHYESECENEFISEVGGAYPKLIDYSGEWLNYANNHDGIGKFPTERVENVTNARFENVVPYTYNSAILKGSTKYRDIDTGDILDTFDETKNLELVSVKMPVLKTVGKNLFDGYLEKGWSSTDGSLIDMDRTRTNLISVEKNETYTVSRNKKTTLKIDEFDGNSNFIKTTTYQTVNVTLTTSAQTKYIRVLIAEPLDEDANHGLQLEKGTQATSYEPYKTNILSVNQDVELRGISDVQDTLDLLTGEIVQNIGEIVIDGTQNGVYDYVTNEQLGLLTLRLPKILDIKNDGINLYGLLSDKYSSVTNKSPNNIYSYSGRIMITKELSELESFNTSDKIKLFLSQNPITLQYPLAEKSIKTVDLSCLDENNNPTKFKPYEGVMYVVTSSETLPPLLDMEVPVEAISQNLASFIK